MKVHLIFACAKGGVESVLSELLERVDADSLLINISRTGWSFNSFRNQKVRLRTIHYTGFLGFCCALFRALIYIKKAKPELIIGWMYKANLLAFVSGLIFSIPTLWTIHNGDLKVYKEKLSYRIFFFVGRVLSRYVNRVIYCSDFCFREHTNAGFERRNSEVIVNGHSETNFMICKLAGANFRQVHNISKRSTVVGWVGRPHRVKNLALFLDICSELFVENENIVGVVCGVSRSEFDSLVSPKSRKNDLRIVLTGRLNSSDLMAAYNAFDVLCLTSVSEASPNVIFEAQLCGCLAVASPVGDLIDYFASEDRLGCVSADVKTESFLSVLRTYSQVGFLKEYAEYRRSAVIDRYSIAKMVEAYGAAWDRAAKTEVEA